MIPTGGLARARCISLAASTRSLSDKKRVLLRLQSEVASMAQHGHLCLRIQEPHRHTHLKDAGSSASASASESLARRLRMFRCLPDGIPLHMTVLSVPQAASSALKP